ncbi:hypothetical protein LPJ59_001538, partial [Coemansia sp. RSA 2399]
MTPPQDDPTDGGAPPLSPTERSGQNRQHHQSRHKHHSRRIHESTTALYRGSSGKGKQKEEHSGDSSSDGSFSESGSASCSTASDYSVENSDPDGNKRRHRHHRRSYAAGSTSHQKQPSARRLSAQNLPVLLRGTVSRRKQVFIDDPVASGDEYSNELAESESPEDDHGRRRRSAVDESSGSNDDNLIEEGDDGTNVRARQEALNTRHPFGLPIWKPALYKKSRSVTRAAFLALHARPLSSEKLYLKPGNIAWMLLAGWWLMSVCLVIAAMLLVVPFGGKYYARVVAGLGWYLFWPFGRYVERIKDDAHQKNRCSMSTIALEDAAALESGGATTSALGRANGDDDDDDDEEMPLLPGGRHPGTGSRLLPRIGASVCHARFKKKTVLGRALYYMVLVLVLNPLLIVVSAASWFAVFSIPMGKLTHTLARYLWRDPLSLHFRSGDLPTVKVAAPQAPDAEAALQVGAGHGDEVQAAASSEHGSSADAAVIEQPAPTVLLCTNEAIGWYYYKYTVDGVNILFYNMLSVAVFVLVAAFVIAPLTNHQHFLVQPAVLFPLCLVSTIPLAYFIGQAVSSISAQSSLGMGAVINATFGSIVEVILYSIALTQGKARLVEGALIGSLLAGLMLMPGTSMIAGGIKHKVQRFNAKSAEVTATLVIMSIIGAFAPTLFYHTFAVPEFECEDEPVVGAGAVRRCKRITMDLLDDPFYQDTVKPF